MIKILKLALLFLLIVIHSCSKPISTPKTIIFEDTVAFCSTAYTFDGHNNIVDVQSQSGNWIDYTVNESTINFFFTKNPLSWNRYADFMIVNTDTTYTFRITQLGIPSVEFAVNFIVEDGINYLSITDVDLHKCVNARFTWMPENLVACYWQYIDYGIPTFLDLIQQDCECIYDVHDIPIKISFIHPITEMLFMSVPIDQFGNYGEFKINRWL